MNPKVVNFHLPPAGQISVAVDSAAPAPTFLLLSHRSGQSVTSRGQEHRPTRAGPGSRWRLASTLGTWIEPAHLPQRSARTEVGTWLAASRSRWPARGETIDEALVNLREALELYFEDGDVPADLVHPLVTSIEICLPA